MALRFKIKFYIIPALRTDGYKPIGLGALDMIFLFYLVENAISDFFISIK